jgi:hypothetical protein
MFYRGDKPRDHKLVKLVAFAPMGSAVCFPVETLVFWALTMASLMLVRPRFEKKTHLRPYGRLFAPFQGNVRELASEICVFGDDIIAPEDCVSTLITTLSSVGCSVNMSKTCRTTPFRESCGSEWFNQSDVTIIRNRRYNYEADLNVKDYPVLLGLQRKFFLRGLFGTAELIAGWCREIYPSITVSIQLYRAINPGRRQFKTVGYRTKGLYGAQESHHSLVFEECGIGMCQSHDPDFFAREEFPLDTFPVLLGWSSSADADVPLRWNRGYQRMEFRSPIEFQNDRAWLLDGYPRLLARLLSDSSDRIAIRNRKVKMAWSYLPFSPLLSKRFDR